MSAGAAERVILVDPADRPLGTAEKIAAHRAGLRHRAFSVFVFNPRGELLLQRRAATKYHSGGLWSNSCCGHPRPGETTASGARRRLREEMGLDCTLRVAGSFEYRARLSPTLWEHEIDHVLTGVCDALPVPDPAEVEDWRWIGPAELAAELNRRPDRFTAWFPEAAERAYSAGDSPGSSPPIRSRRVSS